MPTVVDGPKPEGIFELIQKLQGTNNYFVLAFSGWGQNASGETFANIEITVNGFGNDVVDLGDLKDFLTQIAKNL